MQRLRADSGAALRASLYRLAPWCAQHADRALRCASRANPFVNGSKCLGCGVVLLDLQGLFPRRSGAGPPAGMGFEQFFQAFDRVRDVGVGKALFSDKMAAATR